MNKHFFISTALIAVQIMLIFVIFSAGSPLFGKVPADIGAPIMIIFGLVSIVFAITSIAKKQSIVGCSVSIVANLFLISIFVLGWSLSHGHF